MTDEQIIKALEYHVSDIDDGCKSCVFNGYGNGYGCLKALILAVADLINRQKAEIERLKMIIEQIENDLQPLPFETDFEKAAKRIKSEAIKEFAERLRKYLCLDLREGISVVTADDVDKLVKEMTEGL